MHYNKYIIFNPILINTNLFKGLKKVKEDFFNLKNINENNFDLVSQILKSFEGSKIV
jgi:hypothetical protein